MDYNDQKWNFILGKYEACIWCFVNIRDALNFTKLNFLLFKCWKWECVSSWNRLGYLGCFNVLLDQLYSFLIFYSP